MHYAALNPVGYKLMGLVPWPLITLPSIPEQDFSGRVVNGNIDVKGGDGESAVLVYDVAQEWQG